jgi:hypothetical protein
MAKQVLNVGTHNNDKSGDTLRAGGLKIKANFDEIYAALANDNINISGGNLLKSGSWNDIRNKPDFKRISTTASFNDLEDKPDLVTATATPGSLIGYQGQSSGQIAFDGNNLYVSTADYDGETQIWKYLPWGGSGTTQGYSYTHNQDPTTNGGFSLDNENPTQATVAYISTHDVNGNDIHPFYQYIFGNQLGFLLEVISSTNPDNRALFRVTGIREMDANSMEYYELDLTLILSTNGMVIGSGMWDLHFDFTGGVGSSLGKLKISNSLIGTIDNPDTGGWGAYSLFLDAGGESSSGMILPNPSAQSTGADLEIYHTNQLSGPIKLQTNRGQLLVKQDGNIELSAGLVLPNTALLSGQFNGSEYTFVKNNGGTETDQLSANTIIARDSQQGLYNAALYQSYGAASTAHHIPGIVDNLEWNLDGWADLSNVTSRSYETNWRTAFNNNPGSAVGKEVVIHNTDDDTYHTLKVLTWQNQAQGGGFSYIRRLINTSSPYLFTKTNGGNEVDYIDTDVAITRGGSQAPYNPLVEEGFNSNVSPVNTLWNSDGWQDLSDVTSRSYVTLHAITVTAGGYGQALPNRELVMKDTVNNKYYKIKFLQYVGNNGGGGFKYTRELIDHNNPATGIKFADNSVQNTASTANIPQNKVDFNNIDYWIKNEDANKHLYIEENIWVYVPEHLKYAIPIGTTIVVVTKDNGCTIGPDGSVSIYASGFNTAGAWVMPPRSVSTLLKVEDDVWVLSGAGLVQD